MANPTFRSGPITFAVAADVKKFRLVKVDDKGVSHATASGPVFGAVSNDGAPKAEGAENTVVLGAPNEVAVHIGPATLPLEVNGDAASIKQGSPLFAAADGKVAATGSVLVGFAARPGKDKTVKTTLVTPVAAPTGGSA